VADLSEIIQLIPGYDPVATAPKGWWFDEEAAERVIHFFEECLRHPKDSVGGKAGEPFILEAWQKAVLANTFGWKRPDGMRRYRTVFLGVGRKNGKTTLGAGVGIYLVFCDGEQGAEVYSLAEDADQAAIIWDTARGMIVAEPELKGRCTVYGGVHGRRVIMLNDRSAYWHVLTRTAVTKHGLNPHGVLGDEIHAMADARLLDTMETALGARRQPLEWLMTTSDFERLSICNEKWDLARRVRDGLIADPAFLPVIYEAEPEDEWTDPEVWKKANPNLGVSKSLEYMEAECRKAQATPRYLNEFKRLHLNIRTGQATVWLPMEDWDACAGELDMDALAGRPCHAALDLSATRDTTALVLLFPEDGNAVLPFCFVPQDTALERERAGEAPYETWAREGWMELTPGNVVDQEYVRTRLVELGKLYKVIDVAVDRWNAMHLMTRLQDEDGFTVVEFGQGFKSMNEPSKALETLVAKRGLRHGGHPVLRWQVGNASVKTDPAGNIKPDKATSGDRIDLVVALVMTLGRAMVSTGPARSVYDTRGVLTL